MWLQTPFVHTGAPYVIRQEELFSIGKILYRTPPPLQGMLQCQWPVGIFLWYFWKILYRDNVASPWPYSKYGRSCHLWHWNFYLVYHQQQGNFIATSWTCCKIFIWRSSLIKALLHSGIAPVPRRPTTTLPIQWGPRVWINGHNDTPLGHFQGHWRRNG